MQQTLLLNRYDQESAFMAKWTLLLPFGYGKQGVWLSLKQHPAQNFTHTQKGGLMQP